MKKIGKLLARDSATVARTYETALFVPRRPRPDPGRCSIGLTPS
jgi:hypothetical protein